MSTFLAPDLGSDVTWFTLTLREALPEGWEPGSVNLLKVSLCNNSASTVFWTRENPVTLSYHWLSETGEMLVFDGVRSEIGSFLAPDECRELLVRVVAPEQRVKAVLRVSCVLEGHFWFCDRFASGWFESSIDLRSTPWPLAFQHSRGAKALRGGLSRRLLERSLAQANFGIRIVEPSLKSPEPGKVQAHSLILPTLPGPVERAIFSPALQAIPSTTRHSAAEPQPSSVNEEHVATDLSNGITEEKPVRRGLGKLRALAAVDEAVDHLTAITANTAEVMGKTLKAVGQNSQAMAGLAMRLEARMNSLEASQQAQGQWLEQGFGEVLRGVRHLSEQAAGMADETLDFRGQTLAVQQDVFGRLSDAIHSTNDRINGLHLRVDDAHGRLASMGLSLDSGLKVTQEKVQQVEARARSIEREVHRLQLRHTGFANSIAELRAATEKHFSAAKAHRQEDTANTQRVFDAISVLIEAFHKSVMAGIAELGVVGADRDALIRRKIEEASERILALKTLIDQRHDALLDACQNDGSRFRIELDQLIKAVAQLDESTHAYFATVADASASTGLRFDAAIAQLTGTLSTASDRAASAILEEFRHIRDEGDTNLAAVHALVEQFAAKFATKEPFWQHESGASVNRTLVRVDELNRIVSTEISRLRQCINDLALVDQRFQAITETVRPPDDISCISQKIDSLIHRQVFALPHKRLILCRNEYGIFGVPDSDVDAVSFYASGAVPDQGTIRVIERVLPSGGTFVDVGANIGLFSVAAARKVGPGGRIFALEPDPDTAEALATNLRINGVEQQVTLSRCAAGRRSEELPLYRGRTSGHNSLAQLPGFNEQVQVPVLTLDAIVGSQPVDVLKVDAEGWELEVLAGAVQLIKNNPQLAIIVEFGPAHLARVGVSTEQWLNKIRQLRFEIFEIDRTVAKIVPIRDADLACADSLDLMLCRKLPPVLGGDLSNG